MSLARLLVVALATTLLSDAVTRALPIDWLTFRPWEAALQYRDWEAAFEPRRRIECFRCYGDLANIGNLAKYRVYRHEVFTTDTWGFRNPREATRQGAIRVLLIGDSFAGGAGMADAEMLSSQLAVRLRAGVYNTAPMPLGPEGIEALARRFGMTDGIVLFQHLGWALTPQIGSIVGTPHRQRTVTPRERFVRSFNNDLFPLRILANQVVKRLQNDRLLGNSYSDLVTVDHLTNGDPMLFLTADVRGAPPSTPTVAPWAAGRIRDNVAYYSWLRDRIAAFGLRLTVLLVPHKVTAYRPFLRSTRDSQRQADLYLSELANALRAVGIPTVDLTNAFFEGSRTSLRTREYLYWQDDTHWSPHGVRIAATEIQSQLGRVIDASISSQSSSQ